MTIYSLDVLLSQFGTSLLFHVWFLTCIQISQEVGEVVQYSRLFKNFPVFLWSTQSKAFGFPASRSFLMSQLHIRSPKYCSFSFSISPSNEYLRLICFRTDWFDLLMSKGLSRVFSSTTVQKHWFFGNQPSLWSNSHIHTWLLEKTKPGLYGPLWAK